MAADSCVGFMVLLLRPAVGSTGATTAGRSVEPASGTEGSGAPEVTGALASCGDVTFGRVGPSGDPLQALKTSAARTAMTKTSPVMIDADLGAETGVGCGLPLATALSRRLETAARTGLRSGSAANGVMAKR